MKKSPLYTRTGDRGTTSLVDGTRVAKNSLRLEAYGTVDELNSSIGMILAMKPELSTGDRELITDIQSRLFDIGAWLATDATTNPDLAARLLPADLAGSISVMEAAIDRLHGEVPEIKSFILPAGAPASCACHIARCVARRAERRILDLADSISDIARDGFTLVIAYVNRLSDYLFILARAANALAGVADTPWTPARR